MDGDRTAADGTSRVGSATGLAVGVGAVALLVSFLAVNLVMVNLEGPFGEHGGLGMLAVVAFPTRVDSHESFVERANERSSCLGATFRHYPPGTSDAASDVYCVGLERPLPAG